MTSANMWMLVAIVVTITMMSGCYGDQGLDENGCETVDQTKLVCLRGSSSSTVVSINCPSSSYQVLILGATVYRSANAGGIACPSTHNPDNPMCVEFARDQRCSDNQCSLTVPIPSAGDLCNQGQGINSDPRSRYALVVYRCQPQFSQYANASASAIAIDDPSTVSSPLIAINSHALVLTGVYITKTLSFCSAVIPKHAEVVVRAFFLHAKTTDGPSRPSEPKNSQCVSVAVQDGLKANCIVISSLCSVTDAPLVLGCSETERFLKISYSNNNPNASIVFVMHLQVSYTKKITIQCGSPKFPLIAPTGSLPLEPLDASTKETAAATDDLPGGIPMTKVIVALSCGLGGLTLIVLVIVITAIVCHQYRQRPVQHQPLSETPSIDSISEEKIYWGDQTNEMQFVKV